MPLCPMQYSKKRIPWFNLSNNCVVYSNCGKYLKYYFFFLMKVFDQNCYIICRVFTPVKRYFVPICFRRGCPKIEKLLSTIKLPETKRNINYLVSVIFNIKQLIQPLKVAYRTYEETTADRPKSDLLLHTYLSFN